MTSRTPSQRGRMAKHKGAAGEREAAAALERLFGADFHRGRQYHGGPGTPDIKTSIDELHVEVKRTEALRLYQALEQATHDAGEGKCAMVVHRPSRHPWAAIILLDDLPRLIKILHPYCKDNTDGRQP